ncbi:MAG: hypothetical protein ABIG55_06585 [Candidatus Omnitrophota bacterium]|nr:hypothetical protein [Candidatus Omnitrophota bacterium]
MKISKENFIDHLSALIRFEEDIKGQYEYFLDDIHDPILVVGMRDVINMEDRHIRMVKDMVSRVRETKPSMQMNR